MDIKEMGIENGGKQDFETRRNRNQGIQLGCSRQEVMKRQEKHQTGRLQIKEESWIKTSACMHMQTQIHNHDSIRRLFKRWEKVNFYYRLLKSICLKQHKMLLKIAQGNLQNSNNFQFTDQ